MQRTPGEDVAEGPGDSALFGRLPLYLVTFTRIWVKEWGAKAYWSERPAARMVDVVGA